MTQKAFKTFINEIYSKPPEKNYPTNKTVVYYFDNIWSIIILDSKDYGFGNNRSFTHVLVLIDISSKSSWAIPLKTKMLKQ